MSLVGFDKRGPMFGHPLRRVMKDTVCDGENAGDVLEAQKELFPIKTLP